MSGYSAGFVGLGEVACSSVHTSSSPIPEGRSAGESEASLIRHLIRPCASTQGRAERAAAGSVLAALRITRPGTVYEKLAGSSSPFDYSVLGIGFDSMQGAQISRCRQVARACAKGFQKWLG